MSCNGKIWEYFLKIVKQAGLLNRDLRGMYLFCQLMTAKMPTIVAHNITANRPTHDCYYTNLDHIMTANLPTIGLIV